MAEADGQDPGASAKVPAYKRMWRSPFMIVAVILLVAVAVAVIDNLPEGDSPGVSVNSDLQQAEATVIRQINAMTDCDELQATFDRNADAHDRNLDQGKLDLAQLNTDYMVAADNRMRVVGCYG